MGTAMNSSVVSNGIAPSRRLLLVLAMVVALIAGGVIVSKSLTSAKAGGVGTAETISGGSANEGDAANPGKITFTITASGLFLSPDTVHYKTFPGQGANGATEEPANSTCRVTPQPGCGDFLHTEGNLTFNGAGSQTVDVPLVGDSVVEPDQPFRMEISGGSVGATPIAATGTIVNDDFELSVDDVQVTEGTGATPTNAPVVIKLSGVRTSPTVVNYVTNNGTAKEAEDYTKVDDTVTIPAGQTTATVNVPVIADNKYEDSETFGFTITSGTPAVAVKSDGGFAVVTITDDDIPPVATEQPSFSITDAAVTEGNTGVVALNFTVKLSAASQHTETVKVTTADSSAKQPGDYSSKEATLTFAPGDLSKTFQVAVNGDTLDENNETFTATLSAPSAGAKLTDDVMGVGTINDDDTAPTLSVAAASADEGSDMTFTLTLSAISGRDILVQVGTEDGTAKEPGDYTKVPFTTTVLIPTGATTKTFAVKTLADTVDEPDETFKFDAATEKKNTPDQFNPAVQATGTIKDKTAAPQLAIADVAADEGNTATTDFTFPVTLTGTSTQTVTVAYATSLDTGAAHPAAADDFTATSGTLTFAPGDTTKNVVVKVTGDTDSEDAETFKVTLTNATNAALADATAVGTIKNDDAVPLHPQFIATGAGAGAGAHVREFNGSTPQATSLFPYPDGPGVRVARGDLDNDGHDELIVAPGPGVDSVIKVYNADGSAELASVNAYPGFQGGVYVAAGDVDGDGKAEVITAAGAGGGPHVRTFAFTGAVGSRSLTGSPGFMGADTRNGYSGGLTVASANLDGIGPDEIVVGLASNGPPIVVVWSYNPATNTPTQRGFFAAYDQAFTGGIRVAAGDLDGDGKAEIVTGVGPGGGPHVRVFAANGGGLPGSAFAYDAGFRGGVNVAIGDVDGDGDNEIITAAGPGGGPHVKTFDVLMHELPTGFMAYGQEFHGGVWVAAGTP